MELWKTIEGASAYEVSNLGRVRRKAKKDGSCLKPTVNGSGYETVKLKQDENGKYRTHYLHRVVAEAFIPNLENKIDVNHKDGEKTNNHVSNLEWNTRKENINHAWEIGLFGSESILYEEDVTEIHKLYIPYNKEWNMERLAEMYDVSITTIHKALKVNLMELYLTDNYSFR
ncbi:NUMOD4 motif-containing HNH endonuclease [Bacillus sp. FJAT-50079]|uniref:NUMOD4 motif-containing HNH endonuclease n=1 Tax=Bacillus sp. FJAT-50079 TaxID=2833577 RepID=UPI001BC94288|nr:NUMOD4 motif-containing HNH endonuclease [Bacillus sp. FJAT-50079]MBS4207470.1 NUMOD4 motif-containing HNH endonuclease [Bacillus sp. FJAT-50079]